MNKLLTSGLLVEDSLLKGIIAKIRSNLTVFQGNVNVRNLQCFGDILVGEDSVSIFLCEPENGKVIRAPKTGGLLHVERGVESNVYFVFYQTAEGVIVDKIINGKLDSRRNLAINSKHPIKKMFSSKEFILLVDTCNNLELVNKADIHVDELSQVLKSRTYVLDRKLLFGKLSRAFSSFFSADITMGPDGIVILIAGGHGRHVYKVVLNPESLMPKGPVEKIGKVASSHKIDLKAVYLLEKFAMAEGLNMSRLLITSAAGDSNGVYVSTYNKDTKSYEHFVLQGAAEEPAGVKLVLRFVTQSSFALRKTLMLKAPDGSHRYLCLETNNAGTFARYLVLGGESLTAESQGKTRLSQVEHSILSSANVVEMDEVKVVAMDEPIVEETDEYVE